MPYSSLPQLMLCTQGICGVGTPDHVPVAGDKENQNDIVGRNQEGRGMHASVLVVLVYPLTSYPGCGTCSPLFTLHFCSAGGKRHFTVLRSPFL